MGIATRWVAGMAAMVVLGLGGADRGCSGPKKETVAGPARESGAAFRWSDEDWKIFADKVRWARQNRLDSLPTGTAIARLAVTFVGTTYQPGTLDPPGPEHLVIDFRELDCVTFVENVIAMVRFVQARGDTLLVNRPAAEARYDSLLTALRYRNGKLDGYPSRLHYFSEWLTDNEKRGNLRIVSRSLGGIPDTERIDFMSTHAKAYRALGDSTVIRTIEGIELRLSKTPRWYIPKNAIGAVEKKIQDGDLIAATSSIRGLDVAHTGFAVWRNGALHLLHAPLVGKSVEISEKPLAVRILGISGQDGIMVARLDSTSVR